MMPNGVCRVRARIGTRVDFGDGPAPRRHRGIRDQARQPPHLVRPDAQVVAHQLRMPGERDVARISLSQAGFHMGDRVFELVLQHPGEVILERIHREAMAVAQPVEFEHLLGR